MIRQIAIILAIYLIFLAISFGIFSGVSGGDLAFRLFSLFCLVFYGLVLFAVAQLWKVERQAIILGLLLSFLINLIVSALVSY